MAITATEARQRATRALTAEELSERYAESERDILRRADLGYYWTEQTVPQELTAEYVAYAESQGFTVFLVEHGNDLARSVAPQITTDTLADAVVIWQTYEFSESMMDSDTDTTARATVEIPRDLWAANPTQKYATVDIRVTSGFRVGQELYYKITGTLTAADFSDSSDEGTVVLDELGEAQIILQLKNGIDKIGKTARVQITWDDGHEAVLYTTGVITVRSNTA